LTRRAEEEVCAVRRELLLPVAMLALGLAAAAGFLAASAALSEGGRRESTRLQIVFPEPDEEDEAGPPRLFQRAFAGLVLAEEPDGGGARIKQVIPGSPADDAGLEEGDVITAVDGQSVDSVEDVRDALADKEPGDEVTFRVRRDGQEEDVVVTLGTRAEALPEPPAPPIEVPHPRLDRPFLGVRLADVTPEMREELDLARDQGVVIAEVDRGGPADKAGLRRGDVILMIGSRWVKTAEEAIDAVLDYEPGDAVSLLIRRDSRELSAEVELGARRGMGPPVDLAPSQPEYWSWWRLGTLSDLLPDLGLDLDLDRVDLEELFGRFVRIDAVLLDRVGQRVELHLAAGTLTSVGDAEIRLAPNGGGAELRYSVTERTYVFRGLQKGEIEDLVPGDRALVLTRGDSDEALLIFSPPFAPEGGLSAVPVPGAPELLLPFIDVY
jgi:hypothetical protein